MTIKCSCDDWEPGVQKIDGPIALQQIRGGFDFGPNYFKAWTFCPWCGKALTNGDD